MHNFDLSALLYRDYKLVLGTDCEKDLEASFAGLNTGAGDLMTARLKYNASGFSVNTTPEHVADRVYIVLHSE